MEIPRFYQYSTGGRGDPMVSMLMAAVPVVPVDVAGGAVDAALDQPGTLDNLVLIYHLFVGEHDPLCVIVPSRK